MRILLIPLQAALMAVAAMFPPSLQATVFSLPEPVISPSPDSAVSMDFLPGERIADLDVSPSGGEALVLIETPDGRGSIRIWELRAAPARPIWQAPKGLAVKSIAWHPLQRAFFLSGRRGKTSVILKVSFEGGVWAARPVFETPQILRRLVIGPRPFVTGYPDTSEYRLFFGQKEGMHSPACRAVFR